ncbi:MAG: general stress protein [Candidatus Nanopelagicales bacterium]
MPPEPPDVMQRPVLASFDNYLAAQKAVDTLSDNRFPVQHVAIVGEDLRLVEAVLGRMSWGRAALGGMATFAWFGVLIGLFVSFFGSQDTAPTQMILLGLLFGAAFGIVFGLASYAFTGGRRDFVSRQALQATRYDVRCDAEVIGQARQILGLAPAWPPQATENTDPDQAPDAP